MECEATESRMVETITSRKISKIAKGSGTNIGLSATVLTQLWNFPGTLEKIKAVEEVLEGTGMMF